MPNNFLFIPFEKKFRTNERQKFDQSVVAKFLSRENDEKILLSFFELFLNLFYC
jgi:hypothetical protein